MTKETNVFVKVNLDGNGVAENSTGIPFLDHMLDVSLLIFLFTSFPSIKLNIVSFSSIMVQVLIFSSF